MMSFGDSFKQAKISVTVKILEYQVLGSVCCAHTTVHTTVDCRLVLL